MTNQTNLDKEFQAEVLPSQKGYINLLDEYIPLVDKCISAFKSSLDRKSYWLHLNDKLFAKVPLQELDLINYRSIYNYLSTALSLELDPIGSSLAVNYDPQTRSITPVILLQGYIEILNKNNDFIGIKYENKGSLVDVQLQKRVYQKDENGFVIGYDDITYTTQLPSTIECQIFARTKALPDVATTLPKYIGVVSVSEIGDTRAWQEHPLQMMYNKALTRAVRLSITAGNVMSAFDYEDIQNESIDKSSEPQLHETIIKEPVQKVKAANEAQDEELTQDRMLEDLKAHEKEIKAPSLVKKLLTLEDVEPGLKAKKQEKTTKKDKAKNSSVSSKPVSNQFENVVSLPLNLSEKEFDAIITGSNEPQQVEDSEDQKSKKAKEVESFNLDDYVM